MPETSSTQVWIEEQNYTFECGVQYLINSVRATDDPLALLVILALFDKLDVNAVASSTLEKLQHIIEELPSIYNSGLQQRDCLLVIGYGLWIKFSSMPIEGLPDISLHLKYAQERNWFGEPRLAIAAFSLAHDNISATAAADFLEHHTSEWLVLDFLVGVLCSSLVKTMDVHDERLAYLRQHDWKDDPDEIVALGLIVVTKLIDRGHRLIQLRNRLAKLLLNKLRGYNLCPSRMYPEMAMDDEETATHTVYEVALALCALKISKFDKIYGVLFDNHKTLDAIVRLWRRIEAGGVVVSRSRMVVFQLSVFVNFSLLAWWLISKVGIGELYSAILSLIIAAILMALGQVLRRRGEPTLALLSTLFGEINQSSTFLEEINEPDQPARRLDTE